MALTLVIGNKNYSSWSLRPWLAITHAGIEFQELRIPLNQPSTSEQLRQYSPSMKVPVLIDGDLTIWESLAICEYVAEQEPSKFYPTDRTARAIARAVSAEMHAGFAPLRQTMPMDCRSFRPMEAIPEAVQNDIARITEIWTTCRQQYGSSGDFLFGEFSIADAMYAPVVSRFRTYGVSLDPLCQNYADAIWNLPAMQQWLEAAIAEPEVIEY